HWRKVADIAVQLAEHISHRFLIRCDRVEIAHGCLCQLVWQDHYDPDLTLKNSGGNDRNMQRELILDLGRARFIPSIYKQDIAFDFAKAYPAEQLVEGLASHDRC